MILERLVISDFRVFRGEHSFDLKPRVKYGKKRPIILFGGLNGSGKTTILAAIRLALYGRQSLGMNVSAKDYHDYLAKSIHRSRLDSENQPSSARVGLAFSYASMGMLRHYEVTRAWEINGQSVKESLTISEDEEVLRDLNVDQCQGFLNELVPIGVSDLFFFDGEKIAELAEDAKGEALGDSIKKLLGLDLVETLDADLGILLRNETKKGGAAEPQLRIKALEDKLGQLKGQATDELASYEQLRPREVEAQKAIARLEAELSSKGGAWAATREDAIRKQAALFEERRQLETRLRELMADTLPFVIARDFAKATIEQMRAEAAYKRQEDVAALVSKRLDSFRKKLQSMVDGPHLQRIDDAIVGEFGTLTKPPEDVRIIHDSSERVIGQVESVLMHALEHQSAQVMELATRLEAANEELDRAGKHIARAPEEEQIRPLLDRIKAAYEARTAARARQRVHLENRKRLLREALDLARQLEKESSKLVADVSNRRTLRYAANAKGLLKDFAAAMAKRKIKDLEAEFVQSFHRLARKGDVDLQATIKPTTFSVTLHRPDGVEVDKDELSAGEKQVYAIAILEALARTSGRHLPVIIDTPLGRLDSMHRRNLIEKYFPTASHQVIVLSTDTEVDEAFYAELSSSISHAFRLDYHTDTGSTSATEGYFWRHRLPTKKVG